MSYTTDPKDPRLCRGTDEGKVPQCEVYLILSDEERAKGFVRPLRTKYRHVGPIPNKYPLVDLTEEQKLGHADRGYIKYEKYPESEHPTLGRYWTAEQLANKGCGTVTTMALPLCETYARNPGFYGATYCVGCSRHIPVEEFVWDGTNDRVGS
jgi:hypothetical protein